MFILAVVDTECLHSQWWIQNVYISSGGFRVFIFTVLDIVVTFSDVIFKLISILTRKLSADRKLSSCSQHLI